MPIHYIHRPIPRDTLGDIYRSSSIGLVTPLRDEMNLVCKEYVAAQDPADPGVLILSRFAGAAEELTQAVLVNPYHVEELSEAIRTALEMSLPERQARHAALNECVRRNNTFQWCNSFLASLKQAHDASRCRRAGVSWRRAGGRRRRCAQPFIGCNGRWATARPAASRRRSGRHGAAPQRLCAKGPDRAPSSSVQGAVRVWTCSALRAGAGRGEAENRGRAGNS